MPKPSPLPPKYFSSSRSRLISLSWNVDRPTTTTGQRAQKSETICWRADSRASGDVGREASRIVSGGRGSSGEMEGERRWRGFERRNWRRAASSCGAERGGGVEKVVCSCRAERVAGLKGIISRTFSSEDGDELTRRKWRDLPGPRPVDLDVARDDS